MDGGPLQTVRVGLGIYSHHRLLGADMAVQNSGSFLQVAHVGSAFDCIRHGSAVAARNSPPPPGRLVKTAVF